MLNLFLPVGVLLGAGLVALSSISLNLFLLQFVWVVIGVAILITLSFFDWRSLLNYRWAMGLLYAVVLILLVLVYLKGPVIREARSWLVFGSFTFQPVELAKLALILLYAQYFSRRHLSIARWKNILTSFLFFAAPAALVMLQPDLGSALVLFSIWFGFLIFSGLPRRRVLIALLAFILVGVFAWTSVLKDYQRERILGVVYPEQNALGTNYSVIQAKIAIGSGGFWGKGYGQGSQTQLGFLPEPGTDFILAALIEEWGVFGGFVVIGAFLALEYAILAVGRVADQNFEKFVCLGTAMVFGLQFILNAGSTVGITPVIGVTFPFVSYGGSSMFINFFLLAFVYAIQRRT